MDKLAGVLIGAVIGRVVAEFAADAMESVGIPKHAAQIAGGIIGGLI